MVILWGIAPQNNHKKPLSRTDVNINHLGIHMEVCRMKTNLSYRLSLSLTILLTALAVLSLLPMFGVFQMRTFAPLSTLGLLILAGINCVYRAEVIKKRMLQ